MNLRISQLAVGCGLSLLTLPGMVAAQVPQYHSPLSVPSGPQPQSLPRPASITPGGTVVEDVVVRVNDQIISRSDVERATQQLAQELQQTNASPADTTERQKNMLRDMIDQQLLISRGKELGLNPDAEVVRRLDEIRKQNKFDTMEDLEKAARSSGYSFEDFKSNIRNSVITQEVVRDEVARRLQPSQAQKQAYYEAHKEEFTQPEQVRLSEILIATPADANDAAVAAAKAKAEDIEAKLRAGAKFEDLAKQYSGGQTASQGGDLGLYKRGALAKVLEDQTFSLKTGEMTAPIRTRQGFVLLKVTNHVVPGVPAMKDIEPQIEDALYNEEMQPALRAYLTKLREDSYVDVKAGFVDSGASPNQTKPINFTAYTAPVVKKKPDKEKQKQRFDRSKEFSAAAVGPEKKETALASSTPTIPAIPAENAAAPSTAGASTATTPTTAAGTTTPTTTGAAAASTKTVASAKTTTQANGKPAKIKREKVRYGQAPRNALPAGGEEATEQGTDVGAGSASAAVTPGGIMAQPSTTTEVASTSSSSVSDDPLGPQAAAQKKTRYSDRMKTEAADKAKKKADKAQLKAAATPEAMTSDEKTSQQLQAAPLGLNGDTVKKQKKVKDKNAPKERLQDKTVTPAPQPEARPLKTDVDPNTLQPKAPATPAPAPAEPAPAQTTTPQQ
jgi:peptidyl-prolyl cis-trans isomerase SurA